VNTLNPRLKETRPIQVIEKNLKQIRSMTARPRIRRWRWKR
jgi:hypothetical protein